MIGKCELLGGKKLSKRGTVEKIKVFTFFEKVENRSQNEHQKSSKMVQNGPHERPVTYYSPSRSIFGAIGKSVFFRSAKNRLKIFKNRPWGAQGSILALRPVGPWCIFGQEVPGAASRARTSKEKNDRGAAGGGSDTPGADGPANFMFHY